MRLKIPRKNELGGKKLSGIVAPHDVSFQKKLGPSKMTIFLSANRILILKLVKAIK